MNQKKIEAIFKSFASVLKEDSLNDKEFLVLMANMLVAFGREGLKADENLLAINTSDAAIVELALNQHPDNPYLASILQGHALIKWSENIEG